MPKAYGPKRPFELPRHQIVLVTLRVSSLWRLVFARIGRKRVWYLRSSLAMGSLPERIAAALGAVRINFQEGCRIRGPITVWQHAQLRATEFVTSPQVEKLVVHFGAALGLPQTHVGSLRIGLLRFILKGAADAFAVEHWLSLQDSSRVTIVVDSPWERLLYFDQERKRRVVVSGLSILESMTKKVIRKSPRHTEAEPDDNGNPPLLCSTPAPPHANPKFADADKAELILVLNEALTYGNMYSFGEILSTKQISVLHPSRVALIANRRHEEHGNVVLEYPGLASWHGRFILRRRFRMLLGCFRVWQAWFHPLVSWYLSGLCARALETQAALVAEFPRVTKAVFAYEMQVPLELTIAFALSGVKTFAVNERITGVTNILNPFGVDVLFCANSEIAAAAKESRALHIQESIPVGLARTDLISRYAGTGGYLDISEARARGMKIVLALLYPTTVEPSEDASNPTPTSREAVAHFLVELLDLADNDETIFLVLRGKNVYWRYERVFKSLVDRIENSTRVLLVDDETTPDLPYRLVASADVVVGKYTSLMDESIAMRIPTVVHDYTNTTYGHAQVLARHLPKDLFAYDEESFRDIVSRALVAVETENRTWWNSLAQSAFGQDNDGSVVARIQAFIDDDHRSGAWT